MITAFYFSIGNMAKMITEEGRWGVKKGQNFDYVICERPHRNIVPTVLSADRQCLFCKETNTRRSCIIESILDVHI